ncbi:MAG: hypothetical protein A2X49_17225 [Lentisphaerae bacterium GWF2_52_8]|nr:MAG: hypothetical protein A2X49_17225 [Lentisphaerae bacterium GWF2_52_8]
MELKLRKVEHDPIEDVNPNSLMTDIAKSRMGKLLVISFIAHIILIGVCSIGYINECVHYKTMNIKLAKKQEQEKLKVIEEEKRKQDIIKKAEEEAKKKKEAEKNAPPAAAKTPDEIKIDPNKPTPKIIQELNETSKERPKDSDVNLDIDLK